MSKVQKIIVKEPLGTMGYVIDIDELRLLLEMPGAGKQAVEDALRKRLAHGSADVVLRIITHDGGS
jgi:hypothetical protein